jgi:2,3-bisphosphoglycerate-independent phosphoglycerate mutase
MRGSDSEKPGEDLAKRINSAVSLLNKYDFIHVHTKAPDEAGHQKNPNLKKKSSNCSMKALDGLLRNCHPIRRFCWF